MYNRYVVIGSRGWLYWSCDFATGECEVYKGGELGYTGFLERYPEFLLVFDIDSWLGNV